MLPEIGRRATDVVASRVQGAKSQRRAVVLVKPDVFVKDGVLRFRLVPVKREGMLERAKLFLQTLRGGGQSNLSFGGTLTDSGLDAEKTLRSYYPSLATSLVLSTHPELARGGLRFVDQLSIPADLRPLVERASGAASVTPVKRVTPAYEPPGPIGTTPYVEAESPFEWLRLQRAGSKRRPAGELELDDEGVVAAYLRHGANFLNFFCVVPQDRLRALRLITRARERGWRGELPVAKLNSLTWPETPEAAGALHRAANAFGLDKTAIQFQGQPLELPGAPQSSRRLPARPESAPVPARRTTLAPSHTQTFDPSQTPFNVWPALLDKGSFDYYRAPDDYLEKAFEPGMSKDSLDSLVERLPHYLLARFLTRVSKVSPNSRPDIRAWLETPLPAFFNLKAGVQQLRELAAAVGVDPASVRIQRGDGSTLALTEHASSRTLAGDHLAYIQGRLREVLSEGAVSERLDALGTLLRKGEDASEVGEFVAGARAGIESGTLTPFDFEALSEPEQKRLVEALLAVKHLSATTVLGSLLVKGGDAALATALKALDYTRSRSTNGWPRASAGRAGAGGPRVGAEGLGGGGPGLPPVPAPAGAGEGAQPDDAGRRSAVCPVR